MIDKINTRNEKNDKTVRDRNRNTVVDVEEARSDEDDDDEDDNSEVGPSDTVQTELYDRPLASVKQEFKTRWSSTHGMGESLMKVQESVQM